MSKCLGFLNLALPLNWMRAWICNSPSSWCSDETLINNLSLGQLMFFSSSKTCSFGSGHLGYVRKIFLAFIVKCFGILMSFCV
ncbi:V3 [Nightshade curly top virus]|nr:V3 [Nightshade curly top virus]